MVWFIEDTCEGFRQFHCIILPQERVATGFCPELLWHCIRSAISIFLWQLPSNTTLKNADYSKIKNNFMVKDHRIIEYNHKTESEYSELQGIPWDH